MLEAASTVAFLTTLPAETAVAKLTFSQSPAQARRHSCCFLRMDDATQRNASLEQKENTKCARLF